MRQGRVDLLWLRALRASRWDGGVEMGVPLFPLFFVTFIDAMED